jgi:hypothetical protein
LERNRRSHNAINTNDIRHLCSFTVTAENSGVVLGIVLGVLAAGLLPFGPHALNNVVGVTLVAALLSFVPEMIWKKYSD